MAAKKTLGESPAAPVTEVRESVEHAQVYPGLTKREFFAGLALAGLLCQTDGTPENFAGAAIAAADALLAALAEGA